MTLPHHTIILFCFILVLSGPVSGNEHHNSVVNQSLTVNISEVLPVPDVRSILSNPEQYLGKTVVLNGVVSKTYSRQHQFSVADLVGCSICAAKNSVNSIRVNYSGEIPKNRETVHITGKVINETQNGIIIDATSVII